MKSRQVVALLLVLLCGACAAPTTRQDDAVLRSLSELKVQLAALNEKFAELDQRLPPKPLPKKADIPFDGNPVLGARDSKIGIVEFSDYQCPFCQKFHAEVLPQVQEKYIDTGKVLFVSRDVPMDFHPKAELAAVAANCAGEQGAYFKLQYDLYSQQEQLGRPLYEELARKHQLDVPRFLSCIDNPDHAREVRNDLAYAATLGVQGTPTFFIGRVQGDGLVDAVPMVGVQPYAVFAQALEYFLNQSP
jgi:protein-disulfide isomerase